MVTRRLVRLLLPLLPVVLAISACGPSPNSSSSPSLAGSQTSASPLPQASRKPSLGTNRSASTMPPVPSDQTNPTPLTVTGATYSPVVHEAMAYLAGKTTVPLEAPAGETSYSQAWVQAQPGFYHVHVGQCAWGFPSPAPVQSFGSGQCPEDIASMVTGFEFGGQTYPTATAAQNALLPRSTVNGAANPVDLGYGIQGEEPAGSQGVIDWREGKWTFTVNDSGFLSFEQPTATALSTAKEIVAFLQTHPLPQTSGTLSTGGTGGDPSSGGTAVAWVQGRNVYSVNTMGYNPLSALQVAVTMHPSGGSG